MCVTEIEVVGYLCGYSYIYFFLDLYIHFTSTPQVNNSSPIPKCTMFLFSLKFLNQTYLDWTKFIEKIK